MQPYFTIRRKFSCILVYIYICISLHAEIIIKHYENLKSQNKINLPILIQIAGGTNHESYLKAQKMKVPIDGVGIGSFARKMIVENSDLFEKKFSKIPNHD